jgi:hypothetical protein
LAELDPLFSGWVRGRMRHRSTVPRLVTLPPDVAELRAWIAENPIFSSQEGRKQHVGCSIRACTPASNPLRADFWLSAVPSDHWLGNRIGITVFDGQVQSPPNAAALSFETLGDIFRDALTIMGTAWECEWAAVMPGDFRSEAERPLEPFVKYQSGWMVYLDHSAASQVGKLQGLLVEGLANNGILLTAVPDVRFDPCNPVHRAAATRIQAALGPLNERPSPGD